MEFFKFRTQEQRQKEKTLEEALTSITFSDKFKIGINGNGENKKTKIECAVYHLPIEWNQDSLMGIFRINDRIARAKIGFFHQPALTRTKHYILHKDGNLQETKENAETLYLPLKLTSFFEIVGKVNEDKKTVTPYEDSPFPVLGINGSNGLHPLFLHQEMDVGLKFFGVYKTKNEDASIYSIMQNPEATEEFLKFLKDLRTEFE